MRSWTTPCTTTPAPCPARPGRRRSGATLHCLPGRAVGEILGMVIGLNEPSARTHETLGGELAGG
ncbi:hypothetical protein ROS62_05490 [Streptomyces sp. DSM 41972]|uniref:Uncharacterized protein n=1 Tax=Streptomyces althioticus subsp. attaecolombicae TaxID=3075534 RepID=A0ABU3HUJ5_9ACTN|nr:hypothetical protein [Streptomyces sp. DSM 41972]